MTTTDGARVTDEEITGAVRDASDWIRLHDPRDVPRTIRIIVALADRLAARDGQLAEAITTVEAAEAGLLDLESKLAARDAERAEMVALLERFHRRAMDPMKSMDAGRVVDAQFIEDECEDMLAKLRGTP